LELSPFDHQDDQQQGGQQQGQLPVIQLGTPLPSQDDQQQGQRPTIQLGTPLPSPDDQQQGRLPPIQLGPAPQPCQQRQPSQPRQPNHPANNTEIRDFDQVQDPPFTGDLDAKPISAQDEQLLHEFWQALEADKMDCCSCCHKR
jgi:hypothetical protein